MGEYGILMKDEMVRALLRPVGHPLRKRVTRRTSDQWAKRKVGDLLWVRECWRWCGWADHADYTAGSVAYRADGAILLRACDPGAHNPPEASTTWRPSMLMPRWASRQTLRVVGLWQEPGLSLSRRRPLPEVDDDEARREGVEGRAEYLALWEAINGPVYPELVWRIELEEVSRG